MADKFEDLDPVLKLRIRRTLLLSGAWFGLILVSAGVFVASKPYLDRKREERLKQPGYKPRATPKRPSA